MCSSRSPKAAEGPVGLTGQDGRTVVNCSFKHTNDIQIILNIYLLYLWCNKSNFLWVHWIYPCCLNEASCNNSRFWASKAKIVKDQILLKTTPVLTPIPWYIAFNRQPINFPYTPSCSPSLVHSPLRRFWPYARLLDISPNSNTPLIPSSIARIESCTGDASNDPQRKIGRSKWD